FHVYLDGRATRRSASLSFNGASEEANWSATDTGLPHSLEAGCLPPQNTPKSEIMTPDRQTRILSALGIDPTELIEPAPADRVVLVLSRASGGTPLAKALSSLTKDPLKPEPTVSAEPPEPVQPSPAEPAPTFRTPTSSERALQAIDREARQSEQEGDRNLVERPPFVPSDDPAAPVAPQVDDVPAVGTPEWEDEVTGILLEGVEAALPEPEQVPWLEALTQQLAKGDVQGALQSASDLIEAGDREQDTKAAAIARLTALYQKIEPSRRR
ncbi:MAG: hypothetical protein AAFY03_11310, partial [Pseudomonadota bacterium]